MIKKCFSILILLIIYVSPVSAEDIIFKDLPIRQALAHITSVTGSTYIYIGDDIKINWEREGISRKNITREFESILQKYNLEMGVSGRTITVTKHGSTYNSHGVLFSRLEWISGEELTESLGEVWKDSITIKSISNVIMLSGNRQSIEQLLLKIKKYDTPVSLEVAQIRLNYAPVEKVFEVIKEDEKIKDYVRLDSWTNSIIVRGNNLHQLIVESYCEKLDKPEKRRGYEVVSVSNLDSQTVVEALEEISQGVKVLKLTDSKILITGMPGEVEKVSNMVREIDGDRVQVHISAVVAMLTDEQYKELGVQAGYVSNSVDSTIGLLSAVYDPTVLLKIISKGFEVDVSATNGNAFSSIISEPNLVVKSGKTAEFVVGQNVPIKTGEKVSSEGTVTDTSITREDVGIKLIVTPVVRRGFIDLEIYQEISSITDGRSTIDISINTESMRTSLILADGQTMIIGGIKVLQKTNTSDEVPILGSIPILGSLFGYEYEHGEVRNVVISITANIIKEV